MEDKENRESEEIYILILLGLSFIHLKASICRLINGHNLQKIMVIIT